MRRGAHLEGVEEEPELGARVLVGDAHRLEDAGLHLRIVEPDRAAADLDAVQHEVVAPAVDAPGIGLEVRQVLVARPGEGVVRGGPDARLLVELEERRVDHPQEAPGAARAVLGDEAVLLGEVDAQVRHHRLHGGGLAELEQDEVVRLRPHGGVDGGAQLGGDGLRERRLGPLAALAHLGAGKALRAHPLHVLLELVDLGPREGQRGRHAHRLHDAAGLDHVLQHRHPAPAVLLHERGQVGVRHVEAEVGLVVAVLLHRLVERHALEGARDVHPEHLLPQLDDESLHHLEDVVLLDEAHLDVDLGELGLAVEAQVLVAEAAHDLEVPVEAGDHVELLEELRALGERVELARVEPRGDEEVPRAPRRVLHHEGRLELEEALLGEVVPGEVVHPGPRHERLLQRGPAQVEVAVLEPLLLTRVDLVVDLERGGLGAVEDLEVGGVDLDLAGAELRVHVRPSRDDLAADAHAVLEAELAGQLVHLRPDVLLEDDLGEPFTVAQIDEDRPAVVAPVGYPAEEDDVLTELFLGEFTAGVRALELRDEAGQSSLRG